MQNDFRDYVCRLQATLKSADLAGVEFFGHALLHCWRNGRQLFICGNGGSAGNAIHLANDFLYGVSKTLGSGLRANALSANPAVVTCLANDTGYEQIFSAQLAVLASPGDLLLVLSGSGNSPNILRVLEKSREIGVKSFAVLGYSGGQAKKLADVPLHFPIDDMQISEDIQVIVGHMLMQWLYKNRNQVG